MIILILPLFKYLSPEFLFKNVRFKIIGAFLSWFVSKFNRLCSEPVSVIQLNLNGGALEMASHLPMNFGSRLENLFVLRFLIFIVMYNNLL